MPANVGGNSSGVSQKDSTQPSLYLQSLRRDGFIVIRNFIDSDQLEALREASKHITSTARNNGWPHIRTVPKQYPPWPNNTQGTNIWGVQHLLHPAMLNRKVFAGLYFSDAVLDIVQELMGVGDQHRKKTNTAIGPPETHKGSQAQAPTNAATGSSNETNNNNDNNDNNNDDDDNQLVMELFNLLVSPGSNTDFELCWHRDDIKPTVTPAEEAAQLAQKSPQHSNQLHAQYNIALYPDSSLTVIPGSHRRIRTDTERNASPYEPTLPNQLTVHLSAGDAVFYDSNILHRGTYTGINEHIETGRMTLHGSVGLAGHGNERARQVLQHAVGKWVHLDEEVGFGLNGYIGTRAHAMRARLIAMGTGDDVGYSLEG